MTALSRAGKALMILGLLLSVPGASLSAQTVLTLDEVLQRAAEFNPTYRQALNNLELAGAERREAIGAFLPSLTLSMSTSLRVNRQLTAFDNFGLPIENPVTSWQTASNSGQGVNLSLDLFQGLTRFYAIDQNNATAVARAMAARGSLASVEATLQREFNSSLRQAALLEIEEQARAGRVQDLANTEILFRLADVGAVDVRAAELEIVRQDRSISAGRTAYQKALLALRAAIGDPSLREVEISGTAGEPFDPVALNVESLVQIALERSPTILERGATVEADRAGLKSARGTRWPSLSLSLGGNQAVSGGDRSAFFDPYATDSRFGNMSLSLSIPVFQQFRTSRQIAAADVSLRNSQEALRQTELETERDVRSQYLDLQDAWITYRTNLRARDLAEERLRLAREDFRLAGMTFIALQTAIRDAQTERRNAINSRFDFLNALIALEETVGTGVANNQRGG
jgi:outer membrane protein